MQKLGYTSMKRLDQLKSLSSSVSGTAKTFSFCSRPPDSTSSGSFANLKLTAEKLVKEQASVKTDLEMANNKLKKSLEHIRELEEKLQNAFNENAKLKVKQKEDEKLWNGLESKFSSTKTLCDQLTEILQHLSSQVHDAEKDKEFFEGKLSASVVAVDDLNQQMNGLSMKLEHADETIRNREKEVQELKIEKEEREKFFRDENCRAAKLMEEKDYMIKNFEATIATNRVATESLNSKLVEVNHELKLKEDEIDRLIIIQENLGKEKSDIQFCSDDLVKRLDSSLLEIKNFEAVVHMLAIQLVELDKQSMIFLEKFDGLNLLYDSCFKLVQQERDLATKHAQKQHDQLHDKFLCIKSEKDALKLVNQELNNKISELQKVQESLMSRLSEECQMAKERIQKLESEAETLVSKKIETETLVSKLELQIDTLSESSRSSENKMQDLLQKISELEIENKDNKEKLQAKLQRKVEDMHTLQKESEKHEQRVNLLEKQVDDLHDILEEKEQLILQYNEHENELEEKTTKNQALLSATESRLAEAKKQYDLMLESKQLELSRHLKELSQKNDQAINDIQKKYEMEKLEIVTMEMEKAQNVIGEMEVKCNQKIAEFEEESRQFFVRVQEGHAALVSRLQQEYDMKELNLKAEHGEELKRAQLRAENELKERMTSMRNEHEVQMKALKCQHEDECRKLQDELDLQKTREERQRALLQLQWKVMGDKPQEDQEVNSKKDYSISSHMRKSAGGKRSQHALARPENDEKDSPSFRATQTPVSKLLKKVDNINTGSVLSIPQHHKKVTRREYEVETSNGRTVTTRRRTRSTVMFEKDPRERKKRNTPKANMPRSVVKGVKEGGNPQPSNIGDLFSEGSLNPYTDDPYAFD